MLFESKVAEIENLEIPKGEEVLCTVFICNGEDSDTYLESYIELPQNPKVLKDYLNRFSKIADNAGCITIETDDDAGVYNMNLPIGKNNRKLLHFSNFCKELKKLSIKVLNYSYEIQNNNGFVNQNILDIFVDNILDLPNLLPVNCSLDINDITDNIVDNTHALNHVVKCLQSGESLFNSVNNDVYFSNLKNDYYYINEYNHIQTISFSLLNDWIEEIGYNFATNWKY